MALWLTWSLYTQHRSTSPATHTEPLWRTRIFNILTTAADRVLAGSILAATTTIFWARPMAYRPQPGKSAPSKAGQWQESVITLVAAAKLAFPLITARLFEYRQATRATARAATYAMDPKDKSSPSPYHMT